MNEFHLWFWESVISSFLTKIEVYNSTNQAQCNLKFKTLLLLVISEWEKIKIKIIWWVSGWRSVKLIDCRRSRAKELEFQRILVLTYCMQELRKGFEEQVFLADHLKLIHERISMTIKAIRPYQPYYFEQLFLTISIKK